MYDNGRGVPLDYAEAARWYRMAAEQGNAVAQFNLGVMYANGHGVPQDDAEAVKWYRRAADRGEDRAQFNLGVMYANGHGVPQDDAEVMRWYRMAAEQGNALAQFSLGFMYAGGLGVPQDYVQAHKWYNLAAAQGHEDALKGRDIVAAKMTPADVWVAQRMARNWLAEQRANAAAWPAKCRWRCAVILSASASAGADRPAVSPFLAGSRRQTTGQ